MGVWKRNEVIKNFDLINKNSIAIEDSTSIATIAITGWGQCRVMCRGIGGYKLQKFENTQKLTHFVVNNKTIKKLNYKNVDVIFSRTHKINFISGNKISSNFEQPPSRETKAKKFFNTVNLQINISISRSFV